MERIASRQNPLVRRFRELARGTRASGDALLDGAHLVQEALRSEVPIDLVAIADRVTARDGSAIVEDARRAGARVVQVPDHVLAAMSPVRQPSGIVAIARCRAATLAQVLDGATPLVLVLAGVQDAGNVGAIIRAAEACGATGIICSDGTADPFGWKALRGAMGSSFRMPIAVDHGVSAIVAEARTRGVAVVATTPRDGTPLGSFDLRRPVAIVLGAEGAGLPSDVTASADALLTIPMRAPVESLNVSVAAALILFEASRQREQSLMSLFDDPETPEAAAIDRTAPLAERMRPRTLDEFIGQDALTAPGRPLREAIEHDRLRSIVLWGPPGTGKTTLARLIAGLTRARVRLVQRGALRHQRDPRRHDRGGGGAAAARPADHPLRRRDPPLQQGSTGRVPPARRGGRHRAHRRHHGEPVVRGQLRAAVAIEGPRPEAARTVDGGDAPPARARGSRARPRRAGL